jgi:hypothetical protein
MLACMTPLFGQDDIPDIQLPEIDLEIEDNRKIDYNLTITESVLPDLELDQLIRPEFSESIKIDLEATLPAKIDSPEKQKPVDALILFGYGLNNSLMADFSIFVKQYNPKASIRYRRESQESLFVDEPLEKNSSSLDDLRADLLYSFKNFSLGSEIGYYSRSLDLQKSSIFRKLTRRIVKLDLGPSIRFNAQNDLTLRVQNSFLFTNADSSSDAVTASRGDFDYLLETDILYSQVFGENHYLTAHAGYDFTYLLSMREGTVGAFSAGSEDLFMNAVKAGAGYSTTFIDSIFLKTSLEFLGLFRSDDEGNPVRFDWFVLPQARVGYSLQDFFHCYIEGGGKLQQAGTAAWFRENDYSIMPVDISPSYHWFGKTGISSGLTGWFSLYTDLEFAYNMDVNGQALDVTSTTSEENLYTLTKRPSYFEMTIEAGGTFTARQFFELTFDYQHRFMQGPFRTMRFAPRDSMQAKMTWMIERIGLDFFVEFEARFVRYDENDTLLSDLYLLNTGVDWNWQERIGFGISVNNLLYFAQAYGLSTKQYLDSGYEQQGFGFLAYLRIGF